jgi:hypothetical protein
MRAARTQSTPQKRKTPRITTKKTDTQMAAEVTIAQRCQEVHDRLIETFDRINNGFSQQKRLANDGLQTLENKLAENLRQQEEESSKIPGFEDKPIRLQVRLAIPALHLERQTEDNGITASLLALSRVAPQFPNLDTRTETEIDRLVSEYNDARDQMHKEVKQIDRDMRKQGRLLRGLEAIQDEWKEVEAEANKVPEEQLARNPELQARLSQVRREELQARETRRTAMSRLSASLTRLRLIQLQVTAQNVELRARVEQLVLDDAQSKFLGKKVTSATADLRRCLQGFVADVKRFHTSVSKMLNKAEDRMKEDINSLYDVFDGICLQPEPEPEPEPPAPLKGAKRILQTQVLYLISQFEQSVADLLTSILGPPAGFANFCKASRPGNIRELSPWQKFAQFMSQIESRVLLAAGETGSGKTVFGISAFKNIMFERADAPADIDQFPSRCLIYVPISIFEQWQLQIGALATSAFLIPDDDERKRIAGSRVASEGGKKTAIWQFDVQGADTPFLVVLQAVGYAMSKEAFRVLDLGYFDSEGFKKDNGEVVGAYHTYVAELSEATDLFLIVDEFHKCAFEETVDSSEFMLDGFGNPDVVKLRFREIYYEICDFAMNQVTKNRQAKFLALTATPLTYDPDEAAATLRDSLRALLPFHLALQDPKLQAEADKTKGLRWDSDDVTRIVTAWAATKPATQSLVDFLKQECKGFVSHVIYEQCNWMPSYGNDCADNTVCMWIPDEKGVFQNRRLFDFDLSADAKRNQPTDFVPILVRPIAKKTTTAVEDEEVGAKRKTEYQFLAKGTHVKQFLAQRYPNAAVLIYAPMDLKTGATQASGRILTLVTQIVGPSNVVWFWPTETSKEDTASAKAVVAIDAKVGVNPGKMEAMYAAMRELKKQGKGGTEYLQVLVNTIGAGNKAAIVYGRYQEDRVKIPPAEVRTRSLYVEELKLNQAMLIEAFAAQGKLPPKEPRPIQWLFARIATGLDASGANVEISTIPVRAGTFAAQLLGRIARISGAGESQHGALRAYQTITVSEGKKAPGAGAAAPKPLAMAGPEVDLMKDYYKIRSAANLVVQETLPAAALDRMWFAPDRISGPGREGKVPAKRGPEEEEEEEEKEPIEPATPFSARTDAIWTWVRRMVIYDQLLRSEIIAQLLELESQGPPNPPPVPAPVSPSPATVPPTGLGETKNALAPGGETKRTTQDLGPEPARSILKRRKLTRNLTEYVGELLELLPPKQRLEILPVLSDMLNENGNPDALAAFATSRGYGRFTAREKQLLDEAHNQGDSPKRWMMHAGNKLQDMNLLIQKSLEEKDPKKVLNRIQDVLQLTPSDWPTAFAFAYHFAVSGDELTGKVDQLVRERLRNTPEPLKKQAESIVQLDLADLSSQDLADYRDKFGLAVGKMLEQFGSKQPCPEAELGESKSGGGAEPKRGPAESTSTAPPGPSLAWAPEVDRVSYRLRLRPRKA